jgi:outer membrane protein TolC
MEKSIFFLLLFCRFLSLEGQDVLNDLVKKCWENNDQLKSKYFQLASAEAGWKEAKNLYGPTVTFGTQYTLASGGRKISLPVGDLMNPVYSTLNQLTRTNNFPQIENVNEQFLPNNFYDARFRVSQPIFYPDLAINKKLKQETVSLREIEIKAFKRQLSKDVMHGYFNFLMSQEAISIYNAADTLLNEAKRSTTSMVKNGIAIPSAIARIESQMANIQAEKIEATANNKNAEKYLVFLTKENGVMPTKFFTDNLPKIESLTSNEREEVQQFSQGLKMQQLALQKEQNFYKPKLGAQLDLGSQAFNFDFGPYVLLGLNLEVNLFDSWRHSQRKKVVESEFQSLNSQKKYVEDQLDLQTRIAQETLLASIEQARLFQTRIQVSKKLYKEVFTKYKEGSANYLELVDAQSQLTQMQLQHNISKYNAWMKWADYMYATATFLIP